MCTIVAAVATRPGLPLLVAANRDEFTDRPSRPPFLWTAPGLRVVAPRDERALGTWLGLNERGLFVAVTNRAGLPPDPSRRSRGALVIDALSAPSAAALHQQLAGLDPRAHNPFHLVYADRTDAYLLLNRGHELERQRLEPGLHVVTERSFGAGEGGRAEAIRSTWDDRALDGDPSALAPMLARHADQPLAATCVHADAFGYGTRSSMILALGADWATTRMLWAEGRPCRTPFVDRGELIARLAG